MKTIKNTDDHRLFHRLAQIIIVTLFLLPITIYQLPITSAYAAAPDKLSYQGKLTDSSGSPLVDETYKIVFRIYDAQAGGNKLWEEIYDPAPPVSRGVSVKKGVFSELLGSLNNGSGTYRYLKDIPFNQKCWLSIQVGSDAEMSPRQEIASSAYAFKAERAIGLTDVLPIAAGGTGATTVAAARSNLGVGTASIQTFSTPGTYSWTAPVGVTMVFLTMSGGGGGGGGGVGPGSGQSYYGSGGGGASSEFMVNVPYSVTPGQSYTATVGAGGIGGTGTLVPTPAGNGTGGGSTSFGTLTCRGGGGGGGAGVFESKYGQRGSPGVTPDGGPSITNTTVGSIKGGNGQTGYQYYAQYEGAVGGRGCSSNYIGVGGVGGTGSGTQTGGNATGYGAGGGGGAGYQNSSGNGGNGSQGICVVMY